MPPAQPVLPCKWRHLKLEKAMDNVYQAGMQLANALRLIGKHEEAHDIEVWVLSLTRGESK